jgi:hypothetical protein
MSRHTILVAACGAALSCAALADDTAAIARLLQAAESAGGVVVIPPGDYRLEGRRTLPLPSRTTVTAYGARFHLPARLGDKARIVVFAGTNVTDFTWHGGEFLGHVFDPAQRDNAWEPGASTRIFEITTTTNGGTRDIRFRDVRSDGIAGAVIGVHGLTRKAAQIEIIAPAQRITLENCTLLRSGKFMWDYGHLWQIVTWPEHHEPWEVARARRYFRTDKIRDGIELRDGEDRVRLENRARPIGVSSNAEPREALTFFGPNLPQNIERGRQYFVVGAGADFLQVAEQPRGRPIRFRGSSGAGAGLIHDLLSTYLAAYAPVNAGPGKGAFDITGAVDVRVTGCQLSAPGDTMHIQACRNIVFANNHILGSRMGAFFLAEFCQNAAITGNLVDGSNGSRVMSVEKSCTDVTIVGNTFRNGGRGSWINQPRNLVLAGNIFVNNTTKNEPDPRRGRIAYQTGRPAQFPELYFTLYETNGSYGPVIVRDNIFVLGASAPRDAVTFAPRGHDLQMTGNQFVNGPATIVVDPSCRATVVRGNLGATTKRAPVDFNHGRR